LESTDGKKNIYRVIKQMAKSRQNIVGENCVRTVTEKLIENDQIQELPGMEKVHGEAVK